jgi:hypothetical protein
MYNSIYKTKQLKTSVSVQRMSNKGFHTNISVGTTRKEKEGKTKRELK